jgi:hypothetical protein
MISNTHLQAKHLLIQFLKVEFFCLNNLFLEKKISIS